MVIERIYQTKIPFDFIYLFNKINVLIDIKIENINQCIYFKLLIAKALKSRMALPLVKLYDNI